MKKLTADVVVIGAGTAGLPAAVTAAEGGARVVLFEKRGSTGGTGNRGNMIFGVESKAQLANPPYQTVEEAFLTHMDYTRWHGDARLVKAFYEHTGRTIDWLKEEGVEFQDFIRPGSFGFAGGGDKGKNAPAGGPPGGARTDREPMPNMSSTWIVNGTPPGPRQIGQVAAAMKILTRKAEKLGAQIFTKTSVQQILKRGGRVTGVIAKDDSGEEIQVKAGAVIIATGGCGDSPEMIKRYTGYNADQDMFVLKVLGIKGDGIRMAWEAGAADTVIRMQIMHHLPPPCHGPGGVATEFEAFRQPNLMVNLQGERFAPEVMSGMAFMGHALTRQKGRCGFMIFDGDTKKFYVEQKGLRERTGVTASYQTFKHEDLDDNILEARAKGYNHLFLADSLEELCQQTGINLEGLKKTVTEYNHYCEIGKDEMFYKNAQYLRPVRVPRFYAARFFPGAYGTVGGIRINYNTEVLDKNLDVIPGLYAAGNDANDIYNDSYVPLGGNYMGFAFNTGRMAAESALEYIKK